MASRPIALSDSQLDTIMDAAQPLHPVDRGPFLEKVAQRLNGREPVGSSVVGSLPGPGPARAHPNPARLARPLGHGHGA